MYISKRKCYWHYVPLNFKIFIWNSGFISKKQMYFLVRYFYDKDIKKG